MSELCRDVGQSAKLWEVDCTSVLLVIMVRRKKENINTRGGPERKRWYCPCELKHPVIVCLCLDVNTGIVLYNLFWRGKQLHAIKEIREEEEDPGGRERPG
jgi:hypothetical protein